jgi:hypothetical protein
VRYQVQAKPRLDVGLGIGPSFPWERVSESPHFPGIIVDVGGEQLSCPGDANADFLARARACNACGCSAWSTPRSFTFFRGECR